VRSFKICTDTQTSLGRSRRENEVGGAYDTHGKNRKIHKVLVGKSEGKRPLGRQIRRWEDGMRKDLREIAWGDQDRDR
jgi:hypothetical protein